MTFARALTWSMAAEIAVKVVQPIVFLILASVLSPEDFGVVASAAVIIAFCEVFWQAGMGKALIQTQENTAAAANIVFWTNLTLAATVSAALFPSAELLAISLFQDHRVTAVIQVMTLSIFLGALSSVQAALRQRQMDFRWLFWVRVLSAITAPTVSIPFALLGYKHWALIAGTLAGQIAQVLLLWYRPPFFPTFTYDKQIAFNFIRFGSWVLAAGLLSWFYAWSDALIVGMYLSSSELGLYRSGSSLVYMLYGALFLPLLPVLYSQLAKSNTEGRKFHQVFESSFRLVTFVAVPLSFCLFSGSEAVETMLFDEAWAGVGKVIGIMALMVGFSTVVSLNGEAYRAMGKPHLETVVTGSLLVIYLSVYLVSIKHGLTNFLYARLALSILALFAHVGVAQTVGIINVRNWISSFLTAVASGILCMLAFLFFRRLFLIKPELEFLLLGPSIMISLIVIIGFSRKTIVRDLQVLLKA